MATLTRVTRRLRDLGLLALLVGYPIAAHFVAAAPPTAHLGIVLFAVAPLVAAAALAGWQTRWRIATLVVCAGALVAVALHSELIGRNLALVYFIQTTGTNGALGLLFGRTLVADREPLCTRFARMVRGTLEPAVVRYTRQVTLAWTLFFAAMVLASVALYALAPIGVWSMFANLAMMPLVALMFVVEYAVRTRRFPHLPHKPMLESVRAYWSSPGADAARPR